MQDPNFRKTFGSRLKDLRKQRYWSQKELAASNPLANNHLFKRFRALEQFNDDDRETVITLIDAMIAKQQLQSALLPLDDVANG